MSEKTTVKSIQIEEKKHRFNLPGQTEGGKWTDYSCSRKTSGHFQPDRLLKNLAWSCGLMLVILAMRTANQPGTQSVFSALETGMNTEWDESIGKLRFVSSFLPEEIRDVWKPVEEAAVYAPVEGQIIHAWSEAEPYIELKGTERDVRAVADGEIMSIAHGMEEERIVRVRHEDGTEALYGNLQECFHEIGDLVYAGEPIAVLMTDKPLAFEYRRDGRSIELKNGFLPLDDTE